MGRDHPVLGCDNAAPADGLMERVLRLERIVEQIGCVLLPQNMKDIVEGVPHVPVKRAQNPVVEQIGGAPAPQIWEPVAEGVRLIPQERAESYSGADCVCPCASDHGGCRGSCA